MMRTTLELDDDVVAAARELAAGERRSLGSVISELARRGAPSTTAERFRLLDVNALVALVWDSHVHHEVVRDWFGRSTATSSSSGRSADEPDRLVRFC